MTETLQPWTSDRTDQLVTHIDQVTRELQDAREQLSLEWRSYGDQSGNDQLLDDVASTVDRAQRHLTSATTLLAQRPSADDVDQAEVTALVDHVLPQSLVDLAARTPTAGDAVEVLRFGAFLQALGDDTDPERKLDLYRKHYRDDSTPGTPS